jgi:hypothetical protein
MVTVDDTGDYATWATVSVGSRVEIKDPPLWLVGMEEASV